MSLNTDVITRVYDSFSIFFNWQITLDIATYHSHNADSDALKKSLFLRLLPDSEGALSVFGEDDGDSFQLTDIPTDTVMENALKKATRPCSGSHY